MRHKCLRCNGTRSHRDRGAVSGLCPAALDSKRKRQREWFRLKYQRDWYFRATYLLVRRQKRRAVADARDQVVIDSILERLGRPPGEDLRFRRLD
jgi:hypothetical protein